VGEREDLWAAVAALEAQRPLLGGAVDTALRPLRARLNQLTAATRSEAMKLVTVVFSDLVGFTALSEAMDPEDVRELTAGYFRAWTEAVESRGGIVEKVIGDAVMSVFGLPVAWEDDATRAVDAAWWMVTGGLASIHTGLTMRVGVNTGRTLASTLDERRGDFVVVGDVVNTASRLQAAAPVGGVLLSEETWRLVRKSFRADPQPPLQVKGKREPLRTFVVAGAQSHRFRLDAAMTDTPLVGRDDELAQLAAALDDVDEPGATMRTVVVRGEAGIGKTHLIAELDADLEADSRSFVFLRARATSTQADQAGALLRDLTGSRFDLADGEHIDIALHKFREGVAAIVQLGVEEQEALETIVGMGGAHAAHRDAEAVRYVGVRALARMLSALAERRPVVMLLEDLHWADRASLDALAMALERVADRRILVVATARSEWDAAYSWPEAGRRDTIELGPLAAGAAERLARAVAGGSVEPSVLRRIATAAEGNPFYLGELIRVVDDPRWRNEQVEEAIPATLTGVLQARLETLDPEARRVLQSGASVGSSGQRPWPRCPRGSRTCWAASGPCSGATSSWLSCPRRSPTPRSSPSSTPCCGRSPCRACWPRTGGAGTPSRPPGWKPPRAPSAGPTTSPR
jgi:class 3 adenylate cyclase